MKTRECSAQVALHYNRSKINAGRVKFEPGDIFRVAAEDFPRMARKRQVVALDEAKETQVKTVEPGDVFPVRSSRIWVFGDGPTAPASKEEIKPGDVVFAVNRCFFPALELTPTYYVALDDGTFEAEHDRILSLRSVRKFTSRSNAISGKYTWPDLRFFDVLGELGFSTEIMEVYHGKTSVYCALQLAVQCGLSWYPANEIEIHLAGLDLATLKAKDGSLLTHHYGRGNYNETIFTRMLAGVKYGLSHMNELGIRWWNHSPLLASRIEDVAWQV